MHLCDHCFLLPELSLSSEGAQGARCNGRRLLTGRAPPVAPTLLYAGSPVLNSDCGAVSDLKEPAKNPISQQLHYKEKRAGGGGGGGFLAPTGHWAPTADGDAEARLMRDVC